MTREEFEKLYYSKAIHCNTEEKANHFLALADSLGYRWVDALELINHNLWEEYKKETCYELTKRGFMFADLKFFKRENYQIIEYTLPPKLKVDDKVIVKDTLYTKYTNTNRRVGVIKRVHTSSPMFYTVEITDDYSSGFWYLYETQLEKVKEPIDKEETIDDIIKEIKDNQKRTTILLNRLGTMVKNK